MIETINLTRKFGDLTAVNQLNLSVSEGEVFGFLGPNGAGKTTTVRMLAGLIAPTSGTARVAGFDVGNQADSVRRNIGILTETPGMYDRLSARTNLEIFAELYDVKDVKGQVERYLRQLELWDRRDDPAGTFSKGMRQKLAICRALLHEPPLIFLDEPTSALDPEAALLVRLFIRDLKEQGRTIFLCTHNLEEADLLCDRIALFRSSLLVVDTADNLRNQVYGQQVQVTVRGCIDAHLDCIKALGLEAARSGDNISIRVEEPGKWNPRIIRALVEAGAEVLYVAPVEHSLEKVYLELMS